MPMLIAIIVISGVAGLVARPAIAYGVSGALALLGIVAFVWAVADGKGDDPGWLVAVAIAGGLLAIAACWGAQAVRRSRSTRQTAVA